MRSLSKNKLKYPLEQVLDIKKRRVAAAEKVVKEKQEILDKENKKLQEYREALQKVVDHQKNKLEQLREALDGGTPMHKIEQMRTYLKEVKGRVYEERRKVERQEKQVEKAKKAVEEAKQILKERRLEVDKLNTHKEDWTKKELKEIKRLEAKHLDEVGSLVFLSNRRKEKLREMKKTKRKNNERR